jgi:mono/diheme cytochrome c family protein
MNIHFAKSHYDSTQRGIACVVVVLFFVLPHAAVAGDAEDFFEQRIRPLLLDKCIECHGPTKQENGVRLDRRKDVLEGKAGEIPLINIAAPNESRLLKVLHHAEDDTQMPPSGKLGDEQIQFVQQWIASGAVWPESSDLEGEARRRAERWREHWAFPASSDARLINGCKRRITNRFSCESKPRSPESEIIRGCITQNSYSTVVFRIGRLTS